MAPKTKSTPTSAVFTTSTCPYGTTSAGDDGDVRPSAVEACDDERANTQPGQRAKIAAGRKG